jgi:hypothetical protein
VIDAPPRLQGDNHTLWVLRRYIWDRCVNRNEHYMGCIVGREGMGKSHTALKIASLIDEDFSADRVMFDPDQMVERFKEEDLGAGDVIILDEAGVGMGNRSWYEQEQILLNQVLQTVRNENMAALFTLPALEELDTQTENRLHGYLELTEKRDGEYVSGKYKRLEIDRGPSRRGTYEKYPRRIEGGRKLKITSISFTPPDDELVAAYEERKSAFQEELYDEYLEDDDGGEDADAEETDPRQIATEIVDDGVEPYVYEHPQNGRLLLKDDLIALDYDISKSSANTVKTLVEQQIDLEDEADPAKVGNAVGD